MSRNARELFRTFTLCALLSSPFLVMSAQAQTFSVDTDGVAVVGSSSPIDIGWDFEAGDGITGFQVTISYDASAFTADLTNCLSGASLDTQGCVAPSSGVIGLTFFRGNGLPNLSGSIAFTPVNPGALVNGTEYTLTVQEQAGQTQPSSVTLTTVNGKITSSVIAPSLDVDPTSLSFSTQIATTQTKTVQACNDGNQDGLTFSSFAITGSSTFTQTNDCPTSGLGLAQAACCTVSVSFAPTTIDPNLTGSMTITSSHGSQAVSLSGAGTAGPAGALTITPATFNFGEVLTNSGTSTQVFTVTNTGAAGSSVDVNVPTVAVPFAIATNGCATADLAKDETCTVSVTFTPTADGAASSTLSVSGVDGNDDTKSATSALSGTGISEARPTANPASGASESEVVGPEGSNDFTVVFGNTGNISYDVACSLASTDNTSVWSVTNGGTTTVAAGASHTVTTTCALPDTETYTATLSCAIGSTQTFTYNYECVGLPPLPVPVDNKWALALLALMMLMAASFGFRFMARQ